MAGLVDVLHRLVAFFEVNMPAPGTIAAAGPPGLVWAWLCLRAAGWLKQRHGVRTGYTRKIFHFCTFITVAVLHQTLGTSMVCLFGGMTSLVVLVALLCGDGHPLYEALAREKDAPRRSTFIVVPYLATLVGGLLSNLLFGPAAIAGYLVTGLGDAVGEPVGTRFGRHPYRVLSLGPVRATRTLEGSFAVFLSSLLALLLAVAACPELSLPEWAGPKVLLMALGCAVVEAVSPHGWDNLTLQLVPSWLAGQLLAAPM